MSFRARRVSRSRVAIPEGRQARRGAFPCLPPLPEASTDPNNFMFTGAEVNNFEPKPRLAAAQANNFGFTFPDRRARSGPRPRADLTRTHTTPAARDGVLASDVLAGFDEAPEVVRAFAAGSVTSLLRAELTTVGAHALGELAPELTFAALGPLAGSERALAEMQRARGSEGARTSPAPAPSADPPQTAAPRTRTGATT